MRQLRLADGQLAALVLPDDRPDVARIAIERSTSGRRYDIQLSHIGLSLVAGHRYVLSFLARADRPRTIGVGVARAHAPWSNLGFYEEIQLSDAWQSWERSFTATDGDDDGRVHYDVGGEDVSVELSGMVVRCLTDGQVVAGGRPAPAQPVTATADSVPLGRVDFGSLRRLHPISRHFGFDRGTPVDRHYIERFLARHRGDIRGRVLEVGDRAYTRKYGGDAVSRSDILHVSEGVPDVTIVADLASADHIPSDAFDCIILTQTLQFIFDVRAAVATLHRILAPGGVLLATFSGITQTCDERWRGSWYWNFTTVSARRLFDAAFGAPQVEVEAFGSVLTATSFLHGLASEELTPDELNHRDPAYDVTVAVRAVKSRDLDRPESGSSGGRTSMTRPGNGLLLLMYHRIAQAESDPWSLAVAPESFAEQLEELRAHAAPSTLARAVADLLDGGPDRPTFVVTFDDGYADNLHAALPILTRYEVPATVFVASGPVHDQSEFWWDELEALILGSHALPESLTLELAGRSCQWTSDGSRDCPISPSWRASDPPPSSRHALYLELWRQLRPHTHQVQQRALGELRAWAGVSPFVRPSHRPLTTGELRTLAANPLIEIGAHSITHPVLTGLTPDQQRYEVDGSKTTLEAILGAPVSQFAYPYGLYDQATVRTVAEAGFAAACTTRHGRCRSTDDRLTLPRVAAVEITRREFRGRLEQWLDDIG